MKNMKSKENPLLSVLIPLYNHEKYIIDCLESVKNEGYPSIEIIIVDDGSTDGTSDYLINNKKKINKIIFHKNNHGKGAAIISAKKYIKGRYVAIQDADLEFYHFSLSLL